MTNLNNEIDPTVQLIGDVEMGSGNFISPYCVFIGPLKIGNNNWFGPHVVVGTPGQDTRNPRYDSSDKQIDIGSDNIIREFTAIHKPCYESITKVADRCYLMQSVNVNHDAQIESHAVVTSMAALGGLV